MKDTKRWPWVVATASVALTPLVFLAFDIEVDGLLGVAAGTVLIIGVISLSVVGALLTTRVPGNSIGYLLLAAGALIVSSWVASAYQVAASASPQSPWPGAELAWVLSDTLFIYGIVITLIGIPLVFPNGKLLGPRWRWVVWTSIAAMAALTLAVAFGSETSLDEGARFPVGEVQATTVVDLLEAFNAITAFIAMGGAVAATLVRLRRSRGIERQQMKWLVAVAAVAAVTLPPALIVPIPAISNALMVTALASVAFLPVAIGIAVLRYRLYEIDRIISRTIGWAIVTTALVGAFALLVLGFTTVLEPLTGGNTLAVAGSTLIVVALFAPLRARVQRAVDRRFDRGRYDGEHTLAAFGERLRDEVDLEVIRSDVLATVETSVRPTRVGLWLRGPGVEIE